jgi:hypothetical protein
MPTAAWTFTSLRNCRMASNQIGFPTQGKQPIPVMRIYGDTEEFWNKSFQLPDVELVK